MAAVDISWFEVGPPPVEVSVSWLAFAPPAFTLTAEVGAYVLTGVDAELSAVGVPTTASVSWLEFSVPVAPTVYTLTAEAGAYAMTWAGSTSQVVLEADAGAYVMTGQPASMTAIFDVAQPSINTGDNLRFLKDRNRRPVLFPD